MKKEMLERLHAKVKTTKEQNAKEAELKREKDTKHHEEHKKGLDKIKKAIAATKKGEKKVTIKGQKEALKKKIENYKKVTTEQKAELAKEKKSLADME